MLNPSTADAKDDDATIRRCIAFSKAWGRKQMEVRNLYAYRTAYPVQLWIADDPVGPDNDRHLINHNGDVIVCAWGANARMSRVAQVYRLLHGGAPLVCLGLNKDGSPKHPLYIKNGTPLQPFVLGKGEGA